MNKTCHLTSVHRRYDTRIFFKECQSLKNNGFNVSLIVADGKGDEKVNDINIFDIGKPSNRFKRMTNTTWRVYRKALKINASVYHFHDPELMIIGFILKVLNKKKIIYDIHENYYKITKEKKWIKGIFLRKLTAQIFRLVEKTLTNLFDFNVIVIENLREYYKNTICIKNYPLINKNDVDLKQKTDSIVYVGGISRMRGISEMVDIFRKLYKLNSSLKFFVIGPWADPQKEKEIMDKDLTGIYFLGYMPITEAEKYIKEAKFGFCLYTDSKFEENLPVKMYEYLSYSTPVICTDFPSWKEIIDKERWGIAVNPQDIDENVNILNNAFESVNYKKVYEKCLIFKEKYSWKTEEKKLIEMYLSLF